MTLVNLTAVVERSLKATGPSPGQHRLALTDAYDALPVEVERAICAHETYGEALIEAVRRMTGLHAHRTYFANDMAVSFATPEGWLFESRVVRTGGPNWDTMTVGHRSAAVRGSLTRLWGLRKIDPMIRATGFTTPEEALEHVYSSLPLWWVARMDEGHTPESARVLLGLLISPLAWPHLCWPDDSTLPPKVAPEFINNLPSSE